jgi:DNA-binding MarR family transcriptional regulator
MSPTAALHSQGDLLSLSYLMKRVHSLMADVVEPALMDRGFTYVQYVVLSRVRQGREVTSKDIATQLRYNSGALSRVIDQLVHRGLLARERRNHDRRKVELQLTPAAAGTIDGLIELIVDRLNRALANFSGSEMQDLQRLLVKLATTLQWAIEPALPNGAIASAKGQDKTNT